MLITSDGVSPRKSRSTPSFAPQKDESDSHLKLAGMNYLFKAQMELVLQHIKGFLLSFGELTIEDMKEVLDA